MPARKPEPPPVPHDLDAEESVVGAMLISTAAVEAVLDEVSGPDFYRPSHGRIFDAAVALYTRDEPVDAVTVADALASAGALADVGGRDRVHELAALVPAAGNVRHYARIVRRLATQRGLVNAGQQIAARAMERTDDPSDLIEFAEGAVFEIARSRRAGHDFVVIREMLADGLRRLEELHAAGKAVTGLATGFDPFDRLTAGLQPGNLVVLASRPSIGKSALGLTAARHVVVKERLPVALFTLEMSRAEVTNRLVAIDALVDLSKVTTGRLDAEEWRRVHASFARLDDAPLYIDDSGLLPIAELRSKARRLKMRVPDLALVVVDYLQLVTPATGSDRRSREQQVSEMSRALKALAGELGVPLLMLSQLSREVERRHDKRPILSDLRESGSIEQDADLVAFLYREDYYFPEDVENQGIAELNLAKHRNGPTQMVKLSFVKRYARFSDLPRPGAGDPS